MTREEAAEKYAEIECLGLDWRFPVCAKKAFKTGSDFERERAMKLVDEIKSALREQECDQDCCPCLNNKFIFNSLGKVLAEYEAGQ